MGLQRVEFKAKDGTTMAVEWWRDNGDLVFYVTRKLPKKTWVGREWGFVLAYKAGAVRHPCDRCSDDHPYTNVCPDIFAR
jgi:hypothetical protein